MSALHFGLIKSLSLDLSLCLFNYRLLAVVEQLTHRNRPNKVHQKLRVLFTYRLEKADGEVKALV